MQRIRKKIDSLRSDAGPEVTQDKLEEYGLVGRKLRRYQIHGVRFITKCYEAHHGCILGDEMGLGKTIQVISTFINLKGCKGIHGPFLVLCPLSVIDNWKSEFGRFASNFELITLVGDKAEREEIKHSIKKGNTDSFNVLLTTYEICIREVSFLCNFHWKVIAVDEAHRLKNSKSLLHQELIKFKKDFSVLLTGTPVQNNLSELYSLLSFVAPVIFDQDFEEEFVANFSDIENASGKSKDLQYLLSPFLLRRVKSEVMKDLPQKSEVLLYTGMTDLQKKYYKGILTKDLGIFSNEGSNRTGLKNILVRLRQCVDHPYLFDGVEPEPFELGEHLITASGKLYILDKLLSFLHKRDHKVLMFSQMTRMLDIVQDYLGYRGFTYERLDGSVRGEERYLAIRNFNEMEDTFAFLLSTRAGGQGLNLTSADTVIFIDSDYNPQNDLQAAARAHRLGQTRPVKIIRLVARNTVEEIILKRADEKLKLTNSVIEGGQFSSISQSLNQIAESNLQLVDILKFGLDKLFDSEENIITDKDFERILGKSSDGKWIVDNRKKSDDISHEEEDKEGQQQPEETEAQNMYVYEGHDYSKETSERDKDAFDRMVADMVQEVTSSERATRSVAKLLQPSILDLPSRKRKAMTAEELEERRKKREENAAKRLRLKEERQQMKEEARKRKLELLWKENNYTSLNIIVNEDGDEGSEEDLSDEEEERLAIQYVRGDVTRPINNTGNPAIIVHCVDDSGHWGNGGLFTAISRRSASSVQSYELAGAMEDLHLGDTHLIPFDENGDSNVTEEIYLALIVAQTRDKHHRLLPMNLSALSEGLERAHKAAKQLNATVHLPRIGHTTPGFNWYGTERLIRKHLASRGISTSIYYYPRKQTVSVTKPDLSSSENSDENEGTSGIARENVKQNRTTSEFRESSSEENEESWKSRKKSNKARVSSELSESSSDDSERFTGLRRKPKQTRASNEVARSLPDFFSGIHIYFTGVPEDTVKKLTRYVIAYNGDVESLLCDDVTHIVYDVKDTVSFNAMNCSQKVINVSIRWLEDCVKKQRLLDTAKYT